MNKIENYIHFQNTHIYKKGKESITNSLFLSNNNDDISVKRVDDLNVST